MPRLDDPAEYALIKKVYFSDWEPITDEEDRLEQLDRMESKARINQQNSR
jgi:hypothetical protein